MTTQVMFDPSPSAYIGVIGSASASITVPGITEIGTGTASAFVLSAAPYLGARVDIYNAGSATAGVTVVTDSTSVTLNGQGDRTVTFLAEGNAISLFGVSTTRWHIMSNTGATTT
jgi:hypothetical protein